MKHWMVEKKPEVPTNPSRSLTDSDTSDDNEVNPRFRTSVEEREYGTIPGSAIITCIALSHSTTQANPTVEQGPQSRKTKIKKLPKDKARDKTTQTEKKDKLPK